MAEKYIVNPNVACEEVAGRYYLIAFGDARGTLPYLREINETGSFFWELAEKGCEKDVMLEKAIETYDAPQEVLENGLTAFFYDLIEHGYLIKKETEEPGTDSSPFL